MWSSEWEIMDFPHLNVYPRLSPNIFLSLFCVFSVAAAEFHRTLQWPDGQFPMFRLPPFFLGPWPGQAIFQAESPIFFWGPAIELGWWKMSSFLKIFWVQPGDMISQISHDHPPAIEDCNRRWLTRRHTCPTCRPTYGGYMVATKKMWGKPNTRLSPGEILVSITIGSWSKPPLECFFRRGTHGGQVFAEVWGEFSMFLLHEWSSMAINARILSAMNKYGHPLYVLPEFCFAGICS